MNTVGAVRLDRTEQPLDLIAPAFRADGLAYGPPGEGKIVIIGCGNLLRGDDAVGPMLIRHLWSYGIPDHVLLVDGGTAGMDVGFKMQGARQVIIVDAASTGSAPGTIFKVPGAELEELPPLQGLHSHQFRWDHSLAFARWLLKDEYPNDITVLLIEVDSCLPGAELTPAVDASMRRAARLIVQMWEAAGSLAETVADTVGGTVGDTVGDPVAETIEVG